MPKKQLTFEMWAEEIELGDAKQQIYKISNQYMNMQNVENPRLEQDWRMRQQRVATQTMFN